jgi:DNA-binding NtrC family response regulator
VLIVLSDLNFRAPASEAPAWEQLTLADAEALLIRTCFDRHRGNANLAAEALGISRSALYRRLQSLGIVSSGTTAT